MASGMASGWLLANRSQRANLRLGPVPVESGEHLLSNTRLGKVTVDVLGDRDSAQSARKVMTVVSTFTPAF
jgi:hypothetical protein